MILKAFNFAFYVFPQLINDAGTQLSGVFGFGNANVKKEYSLSHSICTNNEGRAAVHLYVASLWAYLSKIIRLISKCLVSITQAVAHRTLSLTMKMSSTSNMNLLR